MMLWSEDTKLYLLTPEEFRQVPDGFVLTCIDGDTATKGQQEIDEDVRFGHMAWGIGDPENHPQRELLTYTLLKI